MIHKVSELCKKIDGLKTQSTKLYELKYNNPKSPVRDAEVNHMIEDIQATCRLIANDKTKYEKYFCDSNSSIGYNEGYKYLCRDG